MFKALSVLVVVLMMTLSSTSQTTVPKSAGDHFNAGGALLRAGKPTEALVEFRESVRLDPAQPGAHAVIGSVLMLIGKPADAILSFREAIRLAPADGRFRTSICKAYILTRSFDEAVAACEEGVRLAPDSAGARAMLIEAMDRGRRNAADIRRVIDLAATQFPDNELVMATTAVHLGSIGNLTGAAELYERLILKKPEAAVYHASLADVYLRQERDAEAVAEARKALALEPDNAVAQYLMGRLFFELGQHEEASRAFESVMLSGAEFPGVKYYFALSEARRGRKDSAVAALRRCIETEPDNFDYVMELGRTLNDLARYDEAIVPMQKAVQLRPRDVEARSGLGLALFESGRLAEAIAVLEEADRMQPGNEVVTMFLRVARARQQGMPQVEDMKRFAKENPQDVNVRMNLINLLAFSRRISEAEPYIAEIYAIAPADVRFYQSIAVAYSTAGDYDKAVAAYKKSFAIQESPGAYLGLANIFQKAGRAEDASRAYAKVLELKPDSPNIAKLYADHLRDNGKRREALEMYKRTLSMMALNGPALFNAAVLSAKLGEPVAAQSYVEPLRAADPKLAKTLERILRLRMW